jgi:8-oxo-dGTP pyrophosphatase MutT (NUDIX family)
MKMDLIKRLDTRLSDPLPGHEAQYKMAHKVRRSPAPPPGNAKQAGVLALLYPKGTDWHLVLIERQSHNPDDRHRGQISLPGGRYEAGDGHIRNTALREAEEEIGVDASSVQVLGALSELYIPVSNFLVNPFVGWVDHQPRFQPQEAEVKAILEVPFDLLRHPRTIQTTDMKISEQIVLQKVPYFDVFGKIVWGATAMILSELLEILEG